MAALPVSTNTCFVTSILSDFHTAHYQGVLLERILLQQLPVLFWDFVCMSICVHWRIQKCMYERTRTVTAKVTALITP
jgi:hypothetical protein